MSRTLRLGIFIVGSLAILAAGIFLIGKRQFLFGSMYRLQATFDTVAGLQDGADVRVGGIHEGTVKLIKLPTTPGGKVTVVMELEKSTRDVVKKDSVGSIRTEGLVGAKFVEISFGSNEAPRVDDGDTIGSEPPVDISDLIKKSNQILDSTKETASNMNAAADNFKSISGKINQGKGTVGALVNDKKIYNQLSAATAQAQAGAASFQDNMEALKHNWFLRGFFKRRGYSDSTQLTANEIDSLPQDPYIKKFTYDAKQIFAKPDSAKLKSAKTLDEAGKFLRENRFGTAIVVSYAGSKGDVKKVQTLTQARAMVVRDYLVNNFEMEDTLLKTMAVGKNAATAMDGVGRVEIVIYPVGSDLSSSENSEVSSRR